jgi:hypothetical protein
MNIKQGEWYLYLGESPGKVKYTRPVFVKQRKEMPSMTRWDCYMLNKTHTYSEIFNLQRNLPSDRFKTRLAPKELGVWQDE